ETPALPYCLPEKNGRNMLRAWILLLVVAIKTRSDHDRAQTIARRSGTCRRWDAFSRVGARGQAGRGRADRGREHEAAVRPHLRGRRLLFGPDRRGPRRHTLSLPGGWGRLSRSVFALSARGTAWAIPGRRSGFVPVERCGLEGRVPTGP